MSDAPPGTRGWLIRIPVVPRGSEPQFEDRWMVDCAVATSGDSYRYVEVDGTRYSHIIDPTTGRAITTRRIVTVIAQTAADADALASAATVLGGSGMDRIDRYPQIAVRLLEQQSSGRWITWERDALIPQLRSKAWNDEIS